MICECTKYHLAKTCLYLLDFNDVSIDDNYLDLVTDIITGSVQEDIIFKLLSGFFNDPLELPLKKELVKTLKVSGWQVFLDSDDIEKQKLGYKIKSALGDEYKQSFVITSMDNGYIKKRDFVNFIDKFKNAAENDEMVLKNVFTEELSILIKGLENKKTLYPQSFEVLSNVFHLNEIQKNILFYYYLAESFDDLDTLMRRTKADFTTRANALRFFSGILEVSLNKIKKELRTTSKLSQTMLLDIEKTDISLVEHINDFLLDDDDKANSLVFFFEKIDTTKALPLHYHRLEMKDHKVFQFLLNSQKGANLLLYGAPGTGKTEFGKSLAKDLGVDFYSIKTHDSESLNIIKEKRSALMAAKEILPSKSILLVDEAEEILDSCRTIFGKDETDHKSWLNTFMEDHDINIVWVTNDIRMHSSTKRRFDYAVHFEPFSRKQRIEALRNIQNGVKDHIFSTKELENIAKDYTLDPGALNLAFQKIGGSTETQENKKELALQFFNSQMKLLREEDVSEKPIEKFYSPSFVNTSLDEREIVESIQKFYDGHNGIRNLCILFQGKPGTGKTEYAKYISKTLDREMSIKRSSDILSSLWGATEKKIAQIFRTAEKDQDILFLDECDSLLRSRQSAEFSWMVGEVNELLTQMERFKGVLICATNFIDNLDQAAIRRFHLKVRFDDLRPECLKEIYEAFFGRIVSSLPRGQIKELENIKNLTPGDFKAVYNGVILQNKVTHDEIISKLKSEVSYRINRHQIGLV